MSTSVLIVDDDRRLADMLRRTLAYEGYRVDIAYDGREALAKVQSQRPDLIVLDWMLPELDGLSIAQHLREMSAHSAHQPPMVLMLTARDAVADRVTGLDSGADDYLVKPFIPEELLAHVRALLRRAPTGHSDKPLTYADLYLDPATRETRRGARAFALTPTEFELLYYLMLHPRQVLTRERLLQAVWGYDNGNENVLEVYIGYLRTKTEAEGEPRLIHTMRGVGYVLREE